MAVKKNRPGLREMLTFVGLMIGLQLAGSLLFPDRWEGAQGLMPIVAVSLLCGALYFVLRWASRAAARRSE